MRQRGQLRAWGAVLVVAVLLGAAECEEWYEPDSHLISDVEFAELVVKDRSAFKIVKYFSPHCVYCRYLKQVVDMLKHERKWCFRIYDFNCAWYPQHCMENVRSGSFPYTAVHDAEGALHEEIHGFYPEPVIRTIFERIDQQCQEATKRPSSSLTQQDSHSDAQANQPAVEGSVPNHGESNSPQQNGFDQPQAHSQEAEIKIDPSGTPAERQKITVPSHRAQSEGADNYVKYLIYGATVLIAAFYFHKMNKGKELEAHQQHPSQEASPLLDSIAPAPQPAVPVPSNPGTEMEAILQAQSQLSDEIADEEL